MIPRFSSMFFILLNFLKNCLVDCLTVLCFFVYLNNLLGVLVPELLTYHMKVVMPR